MEKEKTKQQRLTQSARKQGDLMTVKRFDRLQWKGSTNGNYFHYYYYLLLFVVIVLIFCQHFRCIHLVFLVGV